MVRTLEDLGTDILVIIFQNLPVTDLVRTVPLVCKSWRKPTLCPLPWRVLKIGVYSNLLHFADPLRFYSNLLNFLISRSQGSSTTVIFPDVYVKGDDVVNFLERCTALETLALPRLQRSTEKSVYDLAVRWKDVQYLYMGLKPSSFQQILGDIRLHVKKLVGLQVTGIIEAEDGAAIVALLPKLRYLNLGGSLIENSTMLRVLKGCCELEEVIVEGCRGLYVDQELLDNASHVRIFKYGLSDFERFLSGHEVDQGRPSSQHGFSFQEMWEQLHAFPYLLNLVFFRPTVEQYGISEYMDLF